jgi:hypothetical protein
MAVIQLRLGRASRLSAESIRRIDSSHAEESKNLHETAENSAKNEGAGT